VSGRVITGDTTSTYTVLYLAYMTKLLGGNEADPTRGIDSLAEHKKNLLAVVRTYPERIQLLTNGQAWINIDVGFTSLPETVASSDIGYVSPLEGSPLFMLAVHAIKGARNPIGAQLLLNYMISPSVQAQWAKESFVGPVNKNVKLDPELAKQVPYGDSLKRLMPMDYVALSDSLQKYREMWNAKIAQP
jgi:putative spermidine/putrescine transport system substrate-binding protein